MKVRLALESDEDAVVALARLDVEETLPHLDFQPAYAHEAYRAYLKTASPTFFVAVQDTGEVVGFLMCYLHGYAFTSGIFTVQEVIYVRPDKRGTRAAALLMREFVTWSDMLNARENLGGNSNGLQSDRTAKFLSRFGFEQVGHFMKRVPGRS